MLMPIPTPYIAAAAAGLTYVGSSKAENASTITLPTMLEGDICFLSVNSDNDSSYGYWRPDGWVLLTGFSPGINRGYSFKVMGATPDTSVTLPSTSGTAIAVAFRGAVGPYVERQNSFGPNGDVIFGSVTAKDGDASLLMGGIDDENVSFTFSSGWTGVQTAQQSDSPNFMTQGAAYQLDLSAGSIAPAAWTHDGSGTENYVSEHFIIGAAAQTIEIVGSATVGGSTTLTLPSGMQEDDIVIVFQGRDDALPTTPTGYTEILGTDISFVRLHSSYKFMGATPDATVTVDSTSASVAVVFRGVDTTTPMDTTAQQSSGSSTTPNPPSITTVTDGAFVLVAGFLDDDLAKGTSRIGESFYLFDDEEYGTSGDGGTTMVGGKYQLTAGTIDPPAFGSNNVDSVVAQTIALRPQA